MKCSKCQFVNRERAEFCKECGLNHEFAYSECGTVYELGSELYDECGDDLRKPKEEDNPIDYSEPRA